jgi:hypothetical protein
MEWREEIAIDQGIALSICGDNWDARLAQRLNIAIDRSLADLKVCGEIFGSAVAAPAPLELKDDGQEAIGSIHTLTLCRVIGTRCLPL